MVSVLYSFISIWLLAFSIQDGVKVVYLECKPDDLSGRVVYQKKGKDIYERAEKIIKDAEEELCQYAVSKNMDLIEVYVTEQVHGQIPTESQKGEVGHVTLLVLFKKT
ncbi:hypothetical protein A33Q_3503 [Indibacter alkaliphilus LW1]|uniref:Uncharacterized protein n=1 Tax=Indibacter alkaliphilus (strain CCUG 57479 / KCTC 22604 / LW1) TaxID=1189612 RepID=S2D2P9_INDAL|nr:hypothetical protein [Indibacter alkaliphilus]EOZ93557.1 hypothetical protein A33Q_3503 [Indibacter alkaliphilus LW1]